MALGNDQCYSTAHPGRSPGGRAPPNPEVIVSTYISDALRDAGTSSIFWMGLAIVSIMAVIGLLVTRRARVGLSSSGEAGTVVRDWTSTGRIDFVGPSLEASDADTPASFYLQVEEIHVLRSFSGIERTEVRWRKATLKEAKTVVIGFHRQMTKETGRANAMAPPAAPASNGA
jgi:hypothetical protein